MTDAPARRGADGVRRRSPRPKDAATLVLVRDGAGGPEVLMGRRPRRQVFMPDQYVFPGGGVEPCDRWVRPATELRPAVAARLARACTPARARSLAAAAVRETFEETGLALGVEAPAAKGTLPPEWRDFHATGLAPALDRLDYIYRAVTPPGLPRRFNARFFLARADDASGTLGGDGELLDLGWVPVTEAMTLPIPYITAVVLEELEHMYASPPDPDRDRPVPVCIRVGQDHVHRQE
ncbi:MAG: NUDIX hydrolase [Rhodospirillaceae bacterium]|nr:NUDIX hydrolase [Rhodospirillaceae bacterium]